MMKVGVKIKIEDIGPLATCLNVARGKIEVELEGERFWIPKRICKVVR